jgi:hypothetical protein
MEKRQKRRLTARDAWAPEPDDFVELRLKGTSVRTGRVEAVMPDRSGFWIAAHGIDARRYVDISHEDFEIWILPPRSIEEDREQELKLVH